MSNHIHLLIKDEDLAITMRKIGASYVYWYNWEYKRSGHLYQDRFRSEVVEDDRYFLTVLRYIHQNPLKARIVKDIKSYQWSSYGDHGGDKKIVDTDFALGMISKEQFIRYSHEENQDECLEYTENNRLNDDEAREIIKSIANVENVDKIQGFEKSRRDEIIRMLKAIDGISIRQIARITGISFNIVKTR